ncbi:MAG: MFS transporter [Hyphomicrobiales bacterium]
MSEHAETLVASKRVQIGTTISLALAMGIASLGTSIANIALPTMAEAFSAPFRHVQMVVVAYLAALTLWSLVAGRLGDRYGLKPMLLVGLGVFLGATILCAISPTLWLLIGARFVQGVGAAFLMTLAMALVRQSTSELRVGKAMGLLGTVSALGTALGPSLGGLLIPVTGWRSIFWVQVPPAAVALLFAVAMLPSNARKDGAADPGVVLDTNIVPSLFVNLLVAAVMMTTLVVGPFYLSLGLGLKEASVGVVMAIGPIISIFSGVPSGRLVDQWGTRRALAIGLTLLAAGAILLALLPSMIGVVGYVLAMIILTPGYQLFQAANNTSALADVSKHRRGTISGLLSLSRNIGLIGGALVMGAVFATGVGTDEFAQAAPAAIETGMRLTFMIAGAMIFAAFLVAFGRGKGEF